MAKEISAGIIVYRRTSAGPRFLLLYHGGQYWNFPKGHIEDVSSGEDESVKRETSLRAAIRETTEETGLKEKDLKLRRSFKEYETYTFFKGKKKIFKVVVFYLAETRNRQILISEEHEGFGWFLYRDARRLMQTYKNSEAVLKKANTFVEGSDRNSSQRGSNPPSRKATQSSISEEKQKTAS